ncbi:hypothetical protein D3P08_21690 [Paenibacillus nanensis]|uniref:Uncharacterized protein n=1 Tax=Paenibacillus nanensis TaxID=393251 RepID=A0A3A1UP88_9BACL|nr:hypothetical protein [Paenibacillus nanensis]RIX50164.1 hypothetical protein D3P08_21690 [Paenibacillus nanensis]
MNSIWELLIPLFIIAFSCSIMAARRGRSPLMWFLLGLVFHVIAMAIIGGTPFSDGSRRDYFGAKKGAAPASGTTLDES